MPDSSTSETLTSGLAWLVGTVLGAGGLLGWANYLLAKSRQPVVLRLDEAQIEVHHANAHKITVDGLIGAAQQLRADNDRLRGERDYWQARALKAERAPLEEELKRLPGGKGN